MDEQERTLVQGRMRAAHPILSERVGSVALAQSNFQNSCRRSPPRKRGLVALLCPMRAAIEY